MRSNSHKFKSEKLDSAHEVDMDVGRLCSFPDISIYIASQTDNITVVDSLWTQDVGVASQGTWLDTVSLRKHWRCTAFDWLLMTVLVYIVSIACWC